MSLHDVWQLGFDFLSQKPVWVQPVNENFSTDGGLLVFRQWDEHQQLTRGFAEQLDDGRRDPDHLMLEMVRSRVFGILAGYEDQNDHDALRSDAVFKLLA
ncbi:MAG TPA: transposase, partial [Pirellulaceae bacterium]|nr:transposase [Pirellulaceae bacterium]